MNAILLFDNGGGKVALNKDRGHYKIIIRLPNYVRLSRRMFYLW